MKPRIAHHHTSFAGDGVGAVAYVSPDQRPHAPRQHRTFCAGGGVMGTTADHGPCGCMTCHKAGKQTPRHDWKLSKVEGTRNLLYPYRVTGVMLTYPPEERALYRDGSFSWMVPDLNDRRFDTSDATIDASALVALERQEARTEF